MYAPPPADAMEFQLETGEPRTVWVRGQEVKVETTAVRVPLADQGPKRPSLQGTHPVVGDRRDDGSIITSSIPVASPE